MDKISFYNISVPFEGYSLLYNTMSDSLIAFTNEEYSVIEPLLNNLAAFSEEYRVTCKSVWLCINSSEPKKKELFVNNTSQLCSKLLNFSIKRFCCSIS